MNATPSPSAQTRDRRVVKRVWWSVAAIAVVGIGAGAAVVFGWMLDETHFDRPSAQFDELGAHLESLAGVEAVEKERWVEAPTFSGPTSWMSVTVEEAGLAGVLAAACSTDYADPVTWSISVRTPSAADVSMHSTPSGENDRCPDFGFDATRLVDEIDRVAPGLAVQPAVWDNGRFAFVTLDDGAAGGYSRMLPLVEHADGLLDAAGLIGDRVVEINSAHLGVIVGPGEGDAYLALLTRLAEDHGVTSFWSDGEGAQADGVEKVQLVAPRAQHAAIEELIGSSGLPVAGLPLRFIAQ